MVCIGLSARFARNNGLLWTWLDHLGHAVASSEWKMGENGGRAGRSPTTNNGGIGSSWRSNTKLRQLRSSRDGSFQWLIEYDILRTSTNTIRCRGSPAASGGRGDRT
uniref:Uncharacterized protein n=1 Tax=Setaria italica TaxID=4555 RepID=K3XQF6_SETIT